MPAVLKLVPGADLDAAPSPRVLVDAGSAAEILWRSNGYIAENEEAPDAAEGEKSQVAESSTSPRRGRPRKGAD